MHHLEQASQADIHILRDLDEQFPAEGIKVVTQEFWEGLLTGRKKTYPGAFAIGEGLMIIDVG
ncbi:MAG: hypothetical protein ACE5Q6_01690 [Dehalococcoidia bacterium]